MKQALLPLYCCIEEDSTFLFPFTVLIICDDCGEPWHLHCNKPRLEKVPDGRFSCQECVAKTMAKMQRCGECQDCTRPDCGECKPCLSKKKYGGDGRYGNACKEKKCKSMRYAAPEKMASVARPAISAKRVTKQEPRKKSQVATKKIAAAAARCARKESTIKASKSRPRPPPGPGWKSKFVQQYGVNCYHWISPERKIGFTRWSAAYEFEELRKKSRNNEYHAWKQYRIAKNGLHSRVILASQYDVDPPVAVDQPTSAGKSKKSSNSGRVAKSTVSSKHATKHVSKKKRQVATKISATKKIAMAAARCAREESTIKASKWITKDVQHTRPRLLPGPGWTSKSVQEYGVNCHHWISPRRKIEFTRRSAAFEFEELRKKSRNDEYHAWKQYRKKGGDSRVISSTQYDVDPTTAAGKSEKPSTSGRVAKSTVYSKHATKNSSTVAAKKMGSQKRSNIKTPKSIIGTGVGKHRLSAKSSQAKRQTPASNGTSTTTPMIASPFKNNTLNDDGGLECSNIKIVCRVEQTKKVSFFQKRFENRILLVEKSLKDTAHPHKVITHNNKRYSLASSKVVQDKKGPFMFMSDNKIELVYVQVSRDLQKELEKLCSFSTERPEKIVARLGKCSMLAYLFINLDASDLANNINRHFPS